jgi:hypothetical protein
MKVRPGSSTIGRCPELSNQQTVLVGADRRSSQAAAIVEGVVLSRRPKRKITGASTFPKREKETSARRGHRVVTVKPLP